MLLESIAVSLKSSLSGVSSIQTNHRERYSRALTPHQQKPSPLPRPASVWGGQCCTKGAHGSPQHSTHVLNIKAGRLCSGTANVSVPKVQRRAGRRKGSVRGSGREREGRGGAGPSGARGSIERSGGGEGKSVAMWASQQVQEMTFKVQLNGSISSLKQGVVENGQSVARRALPARSEDAAR